MRDPTKRALEAVVAGLLFGIFHLAYLSGRFATEQGRGGVTLLLGCAFITAVLWAMLTLRSLAADKPIGPEIDDGLIATAVTAWVMALVPPRASNFLESDATDDFAKAYLPVSLLVVFFVLGAQALWPKREPGFLWLRFFGALALAFPALAALLFFVSGGPEAGAFAARAAAFGVLNAVATAVQWRRAGR